MKENKDLKLFKISRAMYSYYGYDAAIVSAYSEEDARMMNPGFEYDEYITLGDNRAWTRDYDGDEDHFTEIYKDGKWIPFVSDDDIENVETWCESPEDVIVEQLGISSVKRGFVLKSYSE